MGAPLNTDKLDDTEEDRSDNLSHYTIDQHLEQYKALLRPIIIGFGCLFVLLFLGGFITPIIIGLCVKNAEIAKVLLSGNQIFIYVVGTLIAIIVFLGLIGGKRLASLGLPILGDMISKRIQKNKKYDNDDDDAEA